MTVSLGRSLRGAEIMAIVKAVAEQTGEEFHTAHDYVDGDVYRIRQWGYADFGLLVSPSRDEEFIRPDASYDRVVVSSHQWFVPGEDANYDPDSHERVINVVREFGEALGRHLSGATEAEGRPCGRRRSPSVLSASASSRAPTACCAVRRTGRTRRRAPCRSCPWPAEPGPRGSSVTMFRTQAMAWVRNAFASWARALEKAELEIGAIHLHDLRHTGNTYAAESGASLAELMNRRGHTSTRAAEVYLHARRERDREIASSLGKMTKRELRRPRSRARSSDRACSGHGG
ncbi:tyrosine-type recombinase/integrase [Spirillospora sp. CA-128828]|uniref:tyrosine-type recombinase/integrase n=1 Tax=Spirillospora sp. CA-128828 TaxID=3240033 RepID=UPI003D94E387